MRKDLKEELKNKVFLFAMKEPGYDESEHDKIRVSLDSEGCVIVFGEDEMTGIMGLGATPDLAYAEFVRSWAQLGGYDWIRKNKQ